MKISLLALFFSFCSLLVTAQDHFLVDLSNRAPDVQSLVMGYEGTKSIPFLANDVNGQEQSLMAMTGKTVMLWFWNKDCIKCLEQIDALNQLTDKFPKDLQIVAFSDDSKEEVLALQETRPMNFPVIPNSRTLAQGPYGGDLGYPKIFILDKNAMIKWVLPEAEMKQNFDPLTFLEALHRSIP